MVFYMQTCFTILKSPILHVSFLQNLPTMNILDPIFYRTLFYDLSPSDLPGLKIMEKNLRLLNIMIHVIYIL
jgi:hypothetical protein